MLKRLTLKLVTLPVLVACLILAAGERPAAAYCYWDWDMVGDCNNSGGLFFLECCNCIQQSVLADCEAAGGWYDCRFQRCQMPNFVQQFASEALQRTTSEAGLK